MRSLFLFVFKILFFCALSIIAGWKIWFELWMYHGWPGPPGLLASLIGADGERAYDAVMDEMFIICFFVILLFWYGFGFLYRYIFIRRKIT